MITTLFADDLVDLGTVADHVAGLDELRSVLAPFTPDAVAAVTGVAAGDIVRLTHRLAAAPSAAVYGRIGTTTQEFGTVTSWLIDVVNTLTGNLDRPGGAMFTLAAAGAANARGAPGTGRGIRIGRRHTRVQQRPESLGELPVTALAEEIDTPGDGQLKAMVTIAGNPVLSTPDAGRLDAALASLEFMVSVDIYLNETTRHADVVLPVPSALQKPHYDLSLLQLAIRNVANWSEPVLPLDPGQPDEWEVLARLALDRGRTRRDRPGRHRRRGVGATRVEVGPRGPRRRRGDRAARTGPLIDAQLRSGPYDVTLDDLLAHPHGIDFGALQPRLPDALRTPSGRIELAPPELVGDVERLQGALASRRRAAVPADRSAPPSFQQLVDAQHPGAGEGQASLHHAHPPRRRRLPVVARRRLSGGGEPGRSRHRTGRGDRRHHAGRDQHPPRLGSRCPRHPDADRGRARRCQHQHPHRQRLRRRPHRHRRPQRRPRHHHPASRVEAQTRVERTTVVRSTLGRRVNPRLDRPWPRRCGGRSR